MSSDTPEISPLKIVEGEDGEYSLILGTGDNAADDTIVELGHEPNGPFWDGVATLLIQEELPDLEDEIEFDSEAGMFCAISEDREALERLGALMAKIATSDSEVRDVVRRAEEAGFEFDD
jgi:hypothetical protein